MQTYFKTSQGVLHTHLELSCETEMDFKIMLIGQFFLANQKFLKWTNEEPAFLNPRLDNLIFLRHICIDLANIQDCSSIFADRDTVDPDFGDFYRFHQLDVQLGGITKILHPMEHPLCRALD